jgi:UDP-2,3-diacylglucosamine pyrophosphatase LpxH
MPPLTIMAAAIFIVGLIVTLVNFRFLMYPLIPSMNPVTHAKRFSLRGSTLFISDLHLKSDQPFEYAGELRSFIENNNLSNLIINGDLFDSPKDAQEILHTSQPNVSLLDVLGLGELALDMYWVTGSPHHDPSKPTKSRIEGIEALGPCVFIHCGHYEVMAYHGHDMSVIGAFGHAWDRFVSRLSLERLWKRLAKVDKDVWVVFGHTHIPGLDETNRVANCGGWQTKPFVRPTRTGVLFSEGKGTPRSVRIV